MPLKSYPQRLSCASRGKIYDKDEAQEIEGRPAREKSFKIYFLIDTLDLIKKSRDAGFFDFKAFVKSPVIF